MIIDFSKLEANKVETMRGGEGYVVLKKFSDGLNSIVRITIPQNCSIGIHTHTEDQEIIYVIKGKGLCIEDSNTYELEAGQCNYCAQNKNHSIRNPYSEDLELFAVITRQ